MCGIAIAIGWPDAELTVQKLLQGIGHRGDVTDPVTILRKDTAMGTRRLRIVDCERAVQPQLSFDRRLAIALNGEIYNHCELRRELQSLGVAFQTESDTEVLVNALQFWGLRALERFVGMYAFVAVDIASGEFLAARDPFGVKPLYVIQSGSGFVFCSEIRPLLETVPQGDVLLVPPGYMVTRAGCGRYKSLVYPRSDLPVPHDPAKLDELLSEAVRLRLPPDLPVAILFSGGIDSTLVAHYARRHRPYAPCYFVGGVSAPDYPFAAEYAELAGADLRVVPFDPDSEEVFLLLEQVIEVTESFEPNLVRGAVCSLIAAEQMHRDGYRVALCGEGADELFCGYPPLELSFGDEGSDGHAIRDECLLLMNRVSLQRVDRCSMRYQLEMREPFLDPAVVNYALALDSGALVSEFEGLPRGKAPLRDIYNLHTDLPRSIRDRTKIPFGEGAGLNVTPQDSPWKRRFNDEISDAQFLEGRVEFSDFNIQSKEELFYIRSLARTMDISRVPHLRDRAWISYSVGQNRQKLKAYAHFSL
ncbi:MAG TPA: asparagine synthetase B [Pseudolabrys sp.]|nr:asparagine synthetase B [Pseudolabrys sp.]